MTVFSKLQEAISFRIKHKGVRLIFVIEKKINSDLETMNWIDNLLCIRMLVDTPYAHGIFTHHMSELLFHSTRESDPPAHMQINLVNMHSGYTLADCRVVWGCTSSKSQTIPSLPTHC